MSGKTISTHVAEDIAERVKQIADREDRKVSQVAGAALSLYVRLPGEARDALRHIEALGNEEVQEATIQEIASLLVRLDYELAARRVVSEMDTERLGGMEDEEAILEEAVDLTRSPSSGSLARVRKRLDELIPGDERTPGDHETASGDR